MRRLNHGTIYALVFVALLLGSCSSSKTSGSGGKKEVAVSLDLVNVMDDKVKVVAKPAPIKGSTVTYQLP